MTRSTLAIAGGKSQQFTVLEIDTIFNFYKPKPPLSKKVGDRVILSDMGDHEGVATIRLN